MMNSLIYIKLTKFIWNLVKCIPKLVVPIRPKEMCELVGFFWVCRVPKSQAFMGWRLDSPWNGQRREACFRNWFGFWFWWGNRTTRSRHQTWCCEAQKKLIWAVLQWNSQALRVHRKPLCELRAKNLSLASSTPHLRNLWLEFWWSLLLMA